MKIVHLPLDSRPCNWLFPGQLAEWCGHECSVPSEMDFFTTPDSFESSKAFLHKEVENADALVISVEHLCCGSLLESRNDNVSQQEALDRLELLSQLHQARPDLPIYAYGVVMRSSVSALYAGDLQIHRAMTEYSMYTDRAAVTGSAEDAQRAQQARNQVPPHVLKRYEMARARNHAVNRRCVELAGEGVLESLVLLQEDSEPWGFHKAEQRALVQLREACGAANVWLHNGTDEGGALTVMKAIGQRCSVAVRFLGWENGDFIARYEDRPFGENVWSMLDYAGLHIDEQAAEVLAVCCPPDGIQTDWPNPAHEEGLEQEAKELAELIRQGRKVYLLDVTRANGGAPALIEKLSRLVPVSALAGYSAWNTASNSLGTAIAQLMSDQIAGKVNQVFLWERLLDDLVYQGVVRGQLNDELEGEGEDLLHLHFLQKAEERLREMMREYISHDPAMQNAPQYTICLPWGRTFEAEVRLCEAI
ncbi:MAG: DUF4127 family protein [Clostridia bacterium]|nr:DUF4127 family protein [Clostridia bacterium]